MKKIFTLLFGCIALIGQSQITLTPSMRQVAQAGTPITRLPVASTATVSSTDTIMVFKNGVWVKTTVGAGGMGTVTSVSATSPLSSSGGATPTITITSPLPIANGGTNATIANTGFNNLAPSQATHSGKFLQTDGTNGSWQTVTAGWGLTGNAGTVAGTNFIGTTDAAGLMFKVGNIQAGYIDRIYDNTSFGDSAMLARTTGIHNSAFGREVLSRLTTGAKNSGFGWQALKLTTTGDYNTGFGMEALLANTTGSNNTAVGNYALSTSQTVSHNTAIGYYALKANTTGNSNVAVGSNSLATNTTASNNTAVGYGALFANVGAGVNNCAFGESTMNVNTTGDYNTAIGNQSMISNTTGDYNTALGADALRLNVGSSNVVIGYRAGYYFLTESNKFILDNDNRASLAAEKTNAMMYGIFGATVATQSLSINAMTAINSAAVDGVSLNIVGTGATSANYGLQVHNSTGSNNALVVRNDGNVGIGNSAPTVALDVTGDITISERMLNAQGADVASVAGDITLGGDGNTFEITGTNAITLISNVSWQNGSVVRLIFTTTATLTNGTATSGSNITMKLFGGVNFIATADDVVTLILSEMGGTQAWREVSRSVN